MKKLFCILTALLVFASCNKEEQLLEKMNFEAPVFTSSFEDYDLDEKTKTYVDDKYKLQWHAADEISIFTTTLNQKYVFDGNTGDNSGSFTKVQEDKFVTGDNINRNYAVYPYSSAIRLNSSEEIIAILPATQDYAVNSFGKGANTMVAATSGLNDYFLPFKNVGGYLVLKLYGEDVTVKSIYLKGNSGEKLSGRATVKAEYGKMPVVEMAEEATETVELDCGSNGVKLSTSKDEPTQFWFVVPPTIFEKGFTVVVLDSDGVIVQKSTSINYTINRNTVNSMSAFEVNKESCDVPANEIWYTSTDGTVVEPYSTDAFGVKIISNTYKDGKGIIVFDGPVTEIGKHAFDECKRLSTIILPEGVTSIGQGAFGGCESLTSVVLPNGLTTLGQAAFGSCSNLLVINVPESVVNLGVNPFASCANLKFTGKYASADGKCLIKDGELVSFCPGTINSISYHIPKGVSSINERAFVGSNLTTVSIPEGVNSIGKMAFIACPLASVVFPKGLQSIGESAFSSCNALISVSFPESLESIGKSAFS